MRPVEGIAPYDGVAELSRCTPRAKSGCRAGWRALVTVVLDGRSVLRGWRSRLRPWHG